MSRTGVDRPGAGDVVVGLDAGTTSAKAVAVDRAGEILSAGGSDPIAVRATPDGGCEQDPEEIWQASATAGRRAVAGLGSGVGVAALAMAAQSGSVIPVTAGGRAERAITWMDARFRSVPKRWSDGVAARVRAVSGWTPTSGVGLSTIVGLQAQGTRQAAEAARPDEKQHRCRRHSQGSGSPSSVYPRTFIADPAPVSRWASVDDYLVFRLTGQWATNPSNAAGMQLMDVATRTWSDELCGLAGIDAGRLSPIRESGSAAGGLAGEAAAALGLDAGTPVVIGGHDQACAALGLGVVEPGDLFLSAGTAWVLTAVTDRAEVHSLPPSLNLSPHVVGGVWTASENLGGLGAMLAETPPTRIRDAFVACGEKVRHALERAGEFAAAGDELTMVGGGLRFGELPEVMGDIIDRPVVTRPEAAWPALGAARLAAAHLGWTPHEGAP